MLHRRTSAKWLHVGMVRLKQHTISFVMVTSKHVHQCLFFTKAQRARCLQRRCTHFLSTTSFSRENRSLCTHGANTISRCERDRNSGKILFFFFSCECNNVSFPQVCGHWKEDAQVASSAVRNPFDHQSWLFQARQVGQSREIMSGVVRPL